jgi:predicted nucleotide-binding protein (sugar kinase/HSP70/actin superfamily)
MRMERNEVQTVMQWAYTNRIIKAADWVAHSENNIQFVQLTSFGCGPDAFILDEVTDLLKRNGKNATFLKIDDITNIGSMRLRLRSLFDSLRLQGEVHPSSGEEAVHTPPFLPKDRSRKILIPWFGDFYSPFIPAFFKLMGYDAENLAPSDQQSAEHGLKYSNNEICYPATLIVGDFMKALLSGKYKRDEIALAITQTGGQCRATNYISLVKKSMIAAGFNDIPVISISTGGGVFNTQPGFELRWGKIYRELIYCLVFADCLSQMYYASKPREIVPGSADALREKYFALGNAILLAKKPREFLPLTEMAAADFDRAITHKAIPRVGIVGEIFVKYNSFGNRHVVNWLLEQGIEPVIPHISSFFLEGLASSEVRVRDRVERRGTNRIVKNVLERYIFRIVHKMEARMKAFPYYRPLGNPHAEAKHASEIINLNAQFGEGWLIPAELSRFARENINHVVSLQPFGCIANHVISKGIEKRTRELFPDLNLLFLDFDSGMSDANIFNRLHFIASNAIEKSKV